MAERRGLGKGLSTLIPTSTPPATAGAPTTDPTPTTPSDAPVGAQDSPAATPTTQPGQPSDTLPASALRDVPVDAVSPNPHQPRAHFDEESLSDLAASIAEIGVLQPLLVREVSPGRYQLIAGERRWRAAQRARLAEVPVVVRDIDEVASVEQALVENLHRQDLTALEEASAYQQLAEDFGLTHDAVAQRVGKSRSAVTNALRLLTLPASVQGYLADGRLSAGHAKALLGTPDKALQERLAKEAVAGEWSVRATEEAIRAGKGPRRGATGTTSKVPGLRAPGLLELENLLSEHLSTRVHVAMAGKRGKVTIEFADLEDLERIYRSMTGT